MTCFSTSSHSHPAFLFKAPYYSVPPSILGVRGKNGRDNVSHTSVSTLLCCEGSCPCQKREPVTVLFGVQYTLLAQSAGLSRSTALVGHPGGSRLWNDSLISGGRRRLFMKPFKLNSGSLAEQISAISLSKH